MVESSSNKQFCRDCNIFFSLCFHAKVEDVFRNKIIGSIDYVEELKDIHTHHCVEAFTCR